MEATKDLKFIYTFWQANKGPVTSVEQKDDLEIFKVYQKLSFLLLKKNFPNVKVKLKTNTLGWKTIKQLDLMWDEVDVSLDRFNYLDYKEWAYVKAVSMFEEQPPFIHIDFDVMLEKNFLELLNNYKVVYQAPEPVSGHSYYEAFLEDNKHLVTPTFLAYNAGFVFIDTELTSVRKELDEFFTKYKRRNVHNLVYGMALEQLIIPNILKKENRKKFSTLVRLSNLLTGNQSPGKNHLPTLGYRHYVSDTKPTNLTKIQKELLELEKSHVAA